MATEAFSIDRVISGHASPADRQADYPGSFWRLRWLMPVLIFMGIIIGLMIYLWPAFADPEESIITTGFSIVLSALLSAIPPILCFVQNVSRKRQLSRLQSLRHLPLAQTMSYRAAETSMDSVRLVVDADYALPIFLYFLVTFVGFIAMLLGYSHTDYFKHATVMLGGLEDRNELLHLQSYQIGTFAVIAMAFIGSYVYVLGRILDRINNNDLYPISLYYYTARIVIACSAAAVLRHGFGAFNGLLPEGMGTDFTRAILILIGFTVGFAPDLFILVMSRKAFQYFKVWGSRTDPEGPDLPRSLPLLMIDDLTREKIDRLNELGIDSAQVLGRQNPFMLLPRVPYDLGLIVDWISQAQLYALVKDEALKRLRDACIRNIMDLSIRLDDQAAQAETCALLGLSPAAGKALSRQLQEDPSFLRLRELSVALKPIP